jgi:NlpC/P60 family/Bacterial dipeptidyl-peptidase Sh3 domain
MVLFEQLQEHWRQDSTLEYRCRVNLNLYKSPAGEGLVTQAAMGRQLRIEQVAAAALLVKLREDDYPGWVFSQDCEGLVLAEQPYQAPTWSTAQIQACLPQVIAFTQAAMATPNLYLWGGTVAPDYDCSGLMQAAFASVGLPIPRDAYQQEAFVQKIAQDDLQAGDLVFFGTPERITHVALYLGAGRYIHSSGKDQGRNGIGIDSIVDLSEPVSQRYFEQLRGFGRVTNAYQPN